MKNTLRVLLAVWLAAVVVGLATGRNSVLLLGIAVLFVWLFLARATSDVPLSSRGSRALPPMSGNSEPLTAEEERRLREVAPHADTVLPLPVEVGDYLREGDRIRAIRLLTAAPDSKVSFKEAKAMAEILAATRSPH